MDTALYIVSSALGVIALLRKFHDLIKKRDFFLAGALLLLTITAGTAAFYKSNLMRIHSIERQSQALLRDKNGYSKEGFVQAALTFLEKNRDLYPESYDRAKLICLQNNCLEKTYGNSNVASLDRKYNIIEAASAIEGILRGIAAIESDK